MRERHSKEQPSLELGLGGWGGGGGEKALQEEGDIFRKNKRAEEKDSMMSCQPEELGRSMCFYKQILCRGGRQECEPRESRPARGRKGAGSQGL